MSHLERLLDLLPPPYTVATDSVLGQLLGDVALELDAFQEDLDLYQRSHFIGTVFRLREAEKLGALVGVQRLEWEDLGAYRERLLALVTSLRAGAIGPREIRAFVFDYLSRVEAVLGATFVPGLAACPDADAAYEPLPDHPEFRPLALVENPQRARASNTLRASNGRVPYLYRWEEQNRGLDDTVASFDIAGAAPGTPVPILVNTTTGDLIGYRGRLRFGQSLTIGPRGGGAAGDRAAAARLDGRDVSAALFSAAGFHLGTSLAAATLDEQPRLPPLVRGTNRWIFLAIGTYDIPGLDRFFFATPDDDLREAVFDQTRFDHALFPSGTTAHLRMTWFETEPASFEVRVPRTVVIQPGDAPSRIDDVAQALDGSIQRLHGAGVKAAVRFVPFVEEQRQLTTFHLPFKVLDPEGGPSGRDRGFVLGGRFGDSPLGSSRFE